MSLLGEFAFCCWMRADIVVLAVMMSFLAISGADIIFAAVSLRMLSMSLKDVMNSFDGFE